MAVLWTNPSKELNAYVFTFRYIFQNFFGSNYVLMKLNIRDLNENDYGRYRCYAENSEGSGQNFVQLSSKLSQLK